MRRDLSMTARGPEAAVGAFGRDGPPDLLGTADAEGRPEPVLRIADMMKTIFYDVVAR